MSPTDRLGPTPAAVTQSDPPHDGAAAPGLMGIAAEARRAVAFFTDLPVDAVASCTPTAAGWRARVDVVEAKARAGDNDLLATYEVHLSAVGAVERIGRLRRYRRDDLPEELP